MDIAKRLRELREAKGLSQSAIQDQAGLSHAHISRIENGHSTPSLRVVERWAEALDVELYQLFFVGHGQPEAPVLPERIPMGAQERKLLGLFDKMPVDDRASLISLARDLVKWKGKRG